MGKLGKKLAKQQRKNKEVQVQEEMNPLKQQMKEQMAEEKFADAIETMAELARLKCMDPEVMYAGAYSYFMLGDYERAATWIDNTLSFAPNHIMARVLLARLCLLEERTEDGLAIFDFVLEHYQPELAADAAEEIEEILEYYGRNEADKLRRRYPHIAAFLKLGSDAAEPAQTAETPAPAQPAEVPVSAEPVQPAMPAPESPIAAAEPMAKAQAAVAALKNLMARTKPQETAVQPETAAEPVQAAGQSKTAVPEEQAAAKAQSAVAALKNLMAKSNGVKTGENLQQLQQRAGEAFVNNELEKAEELLQSALELDAGDDTTLQGLSLLAVARGDRQGAIGYALRMKATDFMLLDRLRVH